MTLVWAIAGAMLVAAAIVTMARLLAGPSTPRQARRDRHPWWR